MRRVRRLNPTTVAAGQSEMFAVYRYHAVFTDSAEPMLAAEATHRDHAIIEQVIADLKDSALAHLPSGVFTANAAWLVCAAIAHNLTRAAGALAATVPRPRPNRHHPRPADHHPGPDRPLRGPTDVCTYPATGPGKPGSTSCSAAPCMTHSPPPPDHRPHGHNRNHQWKSRADRPINHAHLAEHHRKIN